MSLSRRAFTAGLAIAPLGNAQESPAPQRASTETKPAQQEAPRFFDRHQFETVDVIAELIIPRTDTPGARQARVAEYLDRILDESPEAARMKFMDGLWWLDGYCLRLEAKPFKDVAPDRQMQILTRLYTADEPDLAPGREFVGLAKTWTAKIYYSTQIGQQELNKGGRVPASYAPANCT